MIALPMTVKALRSVLPKLYQMQDAYNNGPALQSLSSFS
jgi:hypothetical protein